MFQVPPCFKRPLLSAQLSGSRIMGCGQSTSEELDTSHSFLPKPINLALAEHWSSCLAPAVCSFFFYCTFASFRWLRSPYYHAHTHTKTHAHTHTVYLTSSEGASIVSRFAPAWLVKVVVQMQICQKLKTLWTKRQNAVEKRDSVAGASKRQVLLSLVETSQQL